MAGPRTRTHVVKLISSANTGYFYTLVRPRTAVPKRMMKFDPKVNARVWFDMKKMSGRTLKAVDPNQAKKR